MDGSRQARSVRRSRGLDDRTIRVRAQRPRAGHVARTRGAPAGGRHRGIVCRWRFRPRDTGLVKIVVRHELRRRGCRNAVAGDPGRPTTKGGLGPQPRTERSGVVLRHDAQATFRRFVARGLEGCRGSTLPSNHGDARDVRLSLPDAWLGRHILCCRRCEK